MEYTNSPNGDAFGALVLYRVGGEVDGADIVAVDKAGRGNGVMKFLKKLT